VANAGSGLFALRRSAGVNRRELFAGVGTVELVSSAFVGTVRRAGPSEKPYHNPVSDQVFPDPDVLRVGDSYYAYGTYTGGGRTASSASRYLYCGRRTSSTGSRSGPISSRNRNGRAIESAGRPESADATAGPSSLTPTRSSAPRIRASASRLRRTPPALSSPGAACSGARLSASPLHRPDAVRGRQSLAVLGEPSGYLRRWSGRRRPRDRRGVTTVRSVCKSFQLLL